MTNEIKTNSIKVPFDREIMGIRVHVSDVTSMQCINERK